MGIEKRVHIAATGQAGDCFHQRIGTGGGCSVNEQDAVCIGLRNDIGFARNPQDEQVIAQATANQKRLQKSIDLYQSQLSLSPEIEEQYKQLTRDNETAHTIYDNLLSNKSAAEMQTEMERKQQGEQMRLLNPASLPSSPSFPIRWMFAVGGAATGLCLGLVAALWFELRDKSMRDEADVLAALQLPTLASLPWVGGDENGGYSKGKFPFGLHGKKAAQLSH